MITAVNNFDFIIDKYQTGVLKTLFCDSPTDATSDCLNVDHVRTGFVVKAIFLVAAIAYSWQFFGVSGVTL